MEKEAIKSKKQLGRMDTVSTKLYQALMKQLIHLRLIL